MEGRRGAIGKILPSLIHINSFVTQLYSSWDRCWGEAAWWNSPVRTNQASQAGITRSQEGSNPFKKSINFCEYCFANMRSLHCRCSYETNCTASFPIHDTVLLIPTRNMTFKISFKMMHMVNQTVFQTIVKRCVFQNANHMMCLEAPDFDSILSQSVFYLRILFKTHYNNRIWSFRMEQPEILYRMIRNAGFYIGPLAHV